MDETDGPINLRILLVCTGNLHRSPFAERILRLRLDEASLDDIAVTSGGISANAGDRVPAEAVAAASEWGVELSGHHARQVTGEMVREADLILTMDAYQLTALATAFPADLEKLHPLTTFDPEGGPEEIEDPAEMGGPGLRAVYARIASCAEGVTAYYAEP